MSKSLYGQNMQNVPKTILEISEYYIFVNTVCNLMTHKWEWQHTHLEFVSVKFHTCTPYTVCQSQTLFVFYDTNITGTILLDMP
jgi:hypothetical protein